MLTLLILDFFFFYLPADLLLIPSFQTTLISSVQWLAVQLVCQCPSNNKDKLDGSVLIHWMQVNNLSDTHEVLRSLCFSVINVFLYVKLMCSN